jgi:hypothetical protein
MAKVAKVAKAEITTMIKAATKHPTPLCQREGQSR